jgi:alkanesulfonate monooxygenase SsuD/methylene tetrahydromethanopterin reductase-like flavin-dependent oxidoreductase (luciferase family)
MVEEYEFDHAWTYDHLGWESFVDKPWFDAVPTLTAAANITSRIKLGILNASPDFRHPAHFARELTALDDIADGRVTLGIGAGSTGFDAQVLGHEPLSPEQRVERLGEFTELLDTILCQDVTTFFGDHYTAVGARRMPGCVQVPRLPFVIAADGRSAMRVAARFGQGWVTTGGQADTQETWWRSVAELSARFTDTLMLEHGAPVRRERYLSVDAAPVYALSSVEHFRDVLGKAGELGFTDVITHWPRSDEPYLGHEAVVEKIAAEVLPELRH